MKLFWFLVVSSFIGLSLGAGGSVGGGGSSVDHGRFTEYAGQHVVAVGEQFSISCTIGMNDYLQWRVNGRPAVPGEAGYTMIEGPGPQGYRVSRLMVRRAHTFHAGEYKCSPYTMNSHSVFVISGSLSETENTRLFKEGNSLLLTCDYNVTTDVDTNWKKNGTEITNDDHYTIYKNSSLYIASLKDHDLGEFSCQTEGQTEAKFFYVVELFFQKHLPKSTTVLEDDKLKLKCQVKGTPTPSVQWLKNGELLMPEENSTRLIFEENDDRVPNASLLIKPIQKADSGNYVCLINQYSLSMNTTTEVRVKDIYAALWPFLGIVAEVTILCAIIFIYEKRRIKPNLADPDMDDSDQKNSAENNKETEVRQRK